MLAILNVLASLSLPGYIVKPYSLDRSCMSSKLYLGLSGSMKVTMRWDCSDSGTAILNPILFAAATRTSQHAVYLAYLPSMVSIFVSRIACLRA